MSLVASHTFSLDLGNPGQKLNFFQKTLDFTFGICYNCDNMKEKKMTPEEENTKYTKPCRVDGKTPCVQYPDDDSCGCDPCESCPVRLNSFSGD